MDPSYTVFIVDDDPELRRSLAWMLSGAGIDVEVFASAEDFQEGYDSARRGCVVLDVRMPKIDGLQLQRDLAERGSKLPVIVMSGHADVPMAVRAMEAGAVSFIEKPFTKDALLTVIRRAMQREREIVEEASQRERDETRIAELTPREREVMRLVCGGESTTRIAQRLEIAVRTVDKHREHILAKTAADSWAELVALSVRLGIINEGCEAGK